jgi:hypothetical protein
MVAVQRLAWAVVVLMPLLIGSSGTASAEDVWVRTVRVTELFAGTASTAESFGPIRASSYLRLHSGQLGARYYVFNPRTNNFAYVNAADVMPSAAPPTDFMAGPRVLAALNVPGRAAGTASIYREPIADDAAWAGDIEHNAPLTAVARVEGDDGEPWIKLDDGSFVREGQVRLPSPVQEMRPGRWIDVDLNEPAIVTAYEDGRVVYSTLTIYGIGDWETPLGTYTLDRRVANETMRGPTWHVTGVLFTQYFTGSGHSIHYNYWSANWGYRGSHGCLGMNYADSLWFWEWATLGTPIVIRY